MLEYTFAVIISLIIIVILDMFVFKTKLILQSKWWLFLGLVIVLQTIVDNYLNGRWWLDSFIVGPYDPVQYSGIRIFETPLENYGFGIAMIWLCAILFEVIERNKALRKSD
jgi:hypothetical protein